MKIQELSYGAPTTIVLRLLGNRASSGAKIGEEATLRRSQAAGKSLLQVGTEAWQVEGVGPADQDALDMVFDTGLPHLGWVARSGQDNTVAIQIHRFAHAVHWDGDVGITFDEKTLESIARVQSGRARVKKVENWLAEQFLLPDLRGSDRPARLFASAGPNQAASSDNAFLLHGKSFSAPVERRNGQLWVRTVRRVRRGQSSAVALTLVKADVEFRDSTFVTTFREEHNAAFQKLLSSGKQYLNHWDGYSERERRQIAERAVTLGSAQYTRVHQIDSRTFRFHLDPNSGKEFLDRLSDEHSDLEASSHPPDGLTDGMVQIEGPRHEASFSGTVAWVNAAACEIALRAPEEREFTPPPKDGAVYLSLAGDRVRLARQRKARNKIAKMETPMPQLGLLLEGAPVQGTPSGRKIIEPTSLAAFAPYRSFTEQQQAAVRLALNTPDIVLIQGPPGTGKTSVITAIQQCLVQLGKEAGNVGHGVLLTSFQHDAVDEVVRRTEVLGLPAVKIGSRQYEDGNRRVQDWCDRKANELRTALSPAGQLQRAVRQVETLVIGYGKQPLSPGHTAELIGQIDRLAGSYLPVTLRSRLMRAHSDLAAATDQPRFAVDDLAPLRRAVSGIRTDPTSFSDDGPHMARKALLRLASQDAFADEDRVLLEEAAAWEESETPPAPFLERVALLRDRLLDLAAPIMAPLRVASDDELVRLFGEVVGALRERLETSADGAAAAVEQFLDELENDPDAVAEAVRDFTAVLAATCQQSSSKAMAEEVGNHIQFDTVIVDEAARANPLDLMIPLCLATRRIILVGDHRQLPHLLEPDIERELETSAEEDILTALRQSMFERLFHYLRAAKHEKGRAEREITLDTQFRMHPVLGAFVSDAFYAEDTKLDSGPNTAALHHGIERYGDLVAVWAHLGQDRFPGEDAGRSKSRPAEATWIAEELLRLCDEAPAEHDFGVIAFYRAQVQAIWTALQAVGLAVRDRSGEYRASGRLTDRLHVGTVDAFQGREFDIVLLSVTRSNNHPGGTSRANRRKYGHLLLTNRLCVAMSRQKRLLIVVGDETMFDAAMTVGEVKGLVSFRELCKEGSHGRVI